MLKQEIINLFKGNSNFNVYTKNDVPYDIYLKFHYPTRIKIVAYREIKKGFITVNQLFTPNGFYPNVDTFISFIDLISIKRNGNNYKFQYENNQLSIKLDEITGDYICRAFDIYKKYVELSFKYQNGIDVPKDTEKAIKYLEETISYTNLSYKEYASIGLKYYDAKNYVKAIAYFKCELNNDLCSHNREYNEIDAYSFYCLGNCYYYGYGVEKDLKRASKYYNLAYLFDKNLTDALYNYALICKEVGETYEIMDKIKKYRSPRFMTLIGECYYNGWGVSKSLYQAEDFLLKACKEDSRAYYILALIAEEKEKYDEYFQYASQAIKEGYNYSYNQLGKAYHYGWGTKIDYEKAFDCYQAMIQLYPDDGHAYYNLGLLYYFGFGISKDLMQTYKNWNLSYSKGYKNIAFDLAKLLIENDCFMHNIKEGIYYLDLAINNNNLDAILYKAKLYDEGKFVEKNKQLSYEILLEGIINEKDSVIIADTFVDYVCNDKFSLDYNDALKSFKDITKVYNNNSSLKKHYEQLKQYYFEAFLKQFNIVKKDVQICQNGTLKARYIFKENDDSYFVDENANLIKTYPFVTLANDVIEGDELILTLVEGNVLFINYLKNPSVNPKLIRLLSGKTVTQIIELTSHAPHNNPKNAMEILKMIAKNDHIIAYFEMAKLFEEHNFINAAMKMYLKVMKYPFTNENAVYIVNARCKEMYFLYKNGLFYPGKMKITHLKKAFDFIEDTMIRKVGNPLYDAYMNVKNDLSVDTLSDLLSVFNASNLKYHINHKTDSEHYYDGLRGFYAAINCAEAILWEEEAYEGNTDAYMWLKHFYEGCADYETSVKWAKKALDAKIPAAVSGSLLYPREYGLDDYDPEEATANLGLAAKMGDFLAQSQLQQRKERNEYYKKRYATVLENDEINEREKREVLEQIEKNIIYTNYGRSLTLSEAQEDGLISYDVLSSFENIKDIFLKKD